jgi:hypothetical protein
MGGGSGGVVSVCTLPGGVTLWRAEAEPDSRSGLRASGVRYSSGWSAGIVNSSGTP